MELIQQARAMASQSSPPAPLEESPKCNGCGLAGICLPEETALLHSGSSGSKDQRPHIRWLFPPRDGSVPLYVQEQGATVSKTSKTLIISKAGQELATVRLADISQLVVLGNVFITPQTLHLLCEEGIPVVHLSTGGWFYGITKGLGQRNAYLRPYNSRLLRIKIDALILQGRS